MPTIDQVFLDCTVRRLAQSRDRILVCLDKLDDSQIWLRGGEHENAIGNLVLHLCGNVRQWIGTGVGQKPDIRVRDREFAARGGITRDELKERLTTTLEDALAIIAAVPAARLLEETTIQGYQRTVLEAIYHVTEHFGQHTAQIMLLTKHATGEDLGFYRHLGAPSHTHTTP